MSQEEEPDDKFQYDQPWNPVSYFEEENEATGGDPSGSAYSPSKLASLFETNKLAVDQDIAMRKRVNSLSNPSELLITDGNENTDLDTLSQYTLEVDNGIKILDTTPAINRKAIFHDLDRLRRWRESVDKPNKEVYINDDDTGSYLYEMSDNTVQESENNLIDLNMDYILNSLPDVTNFDNDVTNVNCYGKLQELENQLNENDNLFTIGSANTGIINTSVVSIISDKKNNVTGEDSELIINKIIVGDMLNGEYSINNISDLNRKNSENESSNQNIENVKVEDLNNADNEHVDNIDSLKDLDISDELDQLFDDTDDTLELPDVPEYLIDISSENEGLTLTEGGNNTNFEFENKISNAGIITANNNNIENNDNMVKNDNIGRVDSTTSSNTFENLTTVTDVDDIDNTNTNVYDLNVEDIISSNETDAVDAFIDYVEDITGGHANTSEGKDITDLCQKNVIFDVNGNGTTEHCVDSTLCDTSDECLAIENILDHIENTEINQKVSETNMHDESMVQVKSELTGNIELFEDAKNTSVELNPIEVKATSAEIFEHSTGNNADVDAGSCTLNAGVIDSRMNSFNSDETTSLNQIINGDESTEIHDSEESSQTSVIGIKSNDYPIPIPKTVDVSSVHYKDSIGCLTPDDDEDIMVASTSGYNANSNRSNPSGDNEPSTSTAGNEKEYNSDSDDINVASSGDVDVDVKSIETETCSLDLDNDDNVSDKASETVSTDLGNADFSVSNIPEVDTLTNVDFQNIDNLDHELVAASDNDIQPNRTNNSDDNTTIDNDANTGLTEISSSMQGAIAIDKTESNIDNSDINNAVFDDPSVSSDGNNTQTTHDTNDNSEQVPEVNRPRPSGSIRRVRFSIDNEDSRDDQDSTSSGSFSEQNAIASSSQGVDGPANAALSSNPEMRTLGWIAPKWIPDSDARVCMTCNTKFTVVKRRHHCRACGKVLCSQCCNMKFHLPYMDYKPVRVCQACCDIMINALNGAAQGDQAQTTQQPIQPTATPINFALPEAPPPYSETIDGQPERLGSTSSSAPPYSEAALPRFDEQPAEVLTAGQAMENLPVMRISPFPNTPINDMMSFQLPGYSTNARQRTSRNRSESEMSAVIMFNSTVTNLPPILRRDNEETRIINNPDLDILMKQMHDENEDPISYIVNKNLVVRVKVVNLDCCVEKKCWCFVSDGMGASNQEEVVILIKCKSYNIEEIVLVRKVLQQMNAIFEKAKHGNAVSDSEQMEFNPNITCMPKNTAMLFYKPTLQCLKKLFLPTSPYLFGMYIEKTEIAWAKNFPLRLLLRIGAEFKYYPCPLFNVLDRPAVYDGVGRTILDLLADFRNFQYTLPRIVGVTINLRGKDTIIKLPRHRFDEVLKAVNASEENVLSLAGNFSPTCDGHLVSVEKDGRYKTQTLSIVLKENRKVTCASFFVMSAALKPDPSGIKAKASIVEDGVMVQVTSEVIQEFKTAIKEMKEYTITAGNPSAEDSSQVGIEWCSADSTDRPKLTSPIDAKPFDNLTNMKIRHSYDYTSNNLTAKIHWVEVYFLPQDNDTTVQRLSARELGQMTSSIAKACMSALSPHLMTLIALEMTRIGLRVNLAAHFVEYKIGANLTTLPPELLPTLDDKLVPAVHNVMSSAQERVAVELIFQLVKIV